MITSDFLTQKARNSQIDKFTILREYFQLLFLRYFYSERFLKTKVYFKGGTAIRFLFNSFRFSEDLDFTVVGDVKIIKSTLENLLPKIEEESSSQVQIKDEKFFDNRGLGYRLVFESDFASQPLGIRLDFSMREKPLEPDTSVLTVYDYPINPPPIVIHLSRGEILAEKIRAIFTRNQPRDLFDLSFLLKQGEKVNWKTVEEKMKYYPEVKYSKEILKEKVEALKDEDIKKDLNQFLPENYRSYYTKKLLVKEVLNGIIYSPEQRVY